MYVVAKHQNVTSQHFYDRVATTYGQLIDRNIFKIDPRNNPWRLKKGTLDLRRYLHKICKHFNTAPTEVFAWEDQRIHELAIFDQLKAQAEYLKGNFDTLLTTVRKHYRPLFKVDGQPYMKVSDLCHRFTYWMKEPKPTLEFMWRLEKLVRLALKQWYWHLPQPLSLMSYTWHPLAFIDMAPCEFLNAVHHHYSGDPDFSKRNDTMHTRSMKTPPTLNDHIDKWDYETQLLTAHYSTFGRFTEWYQDFYLARASTAAFVAVQAAEAALRAASRAAACCPPYLPKVATRLLNQHDAWYATLGDPQTRGCKMKVRVPFQWVRQTFPPSFVAACRLKSGRFCKVPLGVAAEWRHTRVPSDTL